MYFSIYILQNELCKSCWRWNKTKWVVLGWLCCLVWTCYVTEQAAQAVGQRPERHHQSANQGKSSARHTLHLPGGATPLREPVVGASSGPVSRKVPPVSQSKWSFIPVQIALTRRGQTTPKRFKQCPSSAHRAKYVWGNKGELLCLVKMGLELITYNL
jgi:hypothetical protein